ncbi:MAG: ABC transporter permease [Oscillospiraceae bacterium]|nr:ABC transporter permease [Oscillospiraceae bacterium]
MKKNDSVMYAYYQSNMNANQSGGGVDESGQQYRKQSQTKEVWRRFKKNRLAVVGLVILVVLILLAIFAGMFCDYDTKVIGQNYMERLQTPNAQHLLGTDSYGRDILARIIYGSRLSLSIGFLSIFSSLILGMVLGCISGYYGGLVDGVIMRITDIFLAVPPLLLAIAVVGVLGPTFLNLIIAMSVGYVPYFARVVRAPILQIRDKEYIEAAKAVGTGEFRIIVRHVLPNILSPIIVQVSISVADAIKSAASLSFIGLGIQPPAPEWGTMLAEGQDFIRQYPHLIIYPGIIIVITILALNLIGDGLQDAVNPKLKN